jgi:hypothetical protein
MGIIKGNLLMINILNELSKLYKTTCDIRSTTHYLLLLY